MPKAVGSTGYKNGHEFLCDFNWFRIWMQGFITSGIYNLAGFFCTFFWMALVGYFKTGTFLADELSGCIIELY